MYLLAYCVGFFVCTCLCVSDWWCVSLSDWLCVSMCLCFCICVCVYNMFVCVSYIYVSKVVCVYKVVCLMCLCKVGKFFGLGFCWYWMEMRVQIICQWQFFPFWCLFFLVWWFLLGSLLENFTENEPEALFFFICFDHSKFLGLCLLSLCSFFEFYVYHIFWRFDEGYK